MRYLLDVNALVALGHAEHEFHGRVARWVSKTVSNGTSELATCSITELGFVRVLAQATPYGLSIQDARELLVRIKTSDSPRFTFLADDQDISRLPAWVKSARQTTDGHLAQLARAKGAVLATLDRKIPRAFLIPGAK